jgi:hypothetical protein
VACFGISDVPHSVGTVRAGWKRSIGQNDMTAVVVNGIGNLLIAAGDDNGADICFDSTPPDVSDHCLAIDIGQRLLRKPARTKSGWYYENRAISRLLTATGRMMIRIDPQANIERTASDR